MNILLNFSTLKVGGGQNVALNFLSILLKENRINDYYFLVAKDSAIHNYLKNNNCSKIYITSPNPFKRILFELIFSRRLFEKLNIDIIYTYFGFGLFPKKYIQVIGSADSNLFFPEIKFWVGYSYLTLIFKHLIDYYRIWGLHRANGIIFENSILEKRCHELYNINAITTTIYPSISLDYYSEPFHFNFSEKVLNTPKGLFLCGWHLNKNVLTIPLVAFHLKELKVPFHFILTAPNDNSPIHRKFLELLKYYDVEEMVSIIGPVSKSHLKSLYSQIDYVFLLSKLESFSNNIIEAWAFRKILLISNEPWAKAICGDAAIYVNRDSAFSIAEVIKGILTDHSLKSSVINCGDDLFNSYPTLMERFNLEMAFLKKVYEKI